MREDSDPRLDKALARYQVIASYIADPPRRGRRKAVRDKLAAKVWTGPDGEPFTVSDETIRVWVRRYNREGLDGLMDKERTRRGVTALSSETIDLACTLKEEVPQRTIDKIIKILEAIEAVEPGTVKRSTLHRALRARGLSRAPTLRDDKDLDRFEAAAPNDLWQSDMLIGPWLPDPERPGKMRRTWLYAFLDDHSRLLLHGRFSFKGDLPTLELVFRRALQKYGLCRRVYYDNGQVYRSRHMKQIVATLGMQRTIFTQAYRPMGHGKIEAFNRFAKRNFIAEVSASKIETVDELNDAFRAWMAVEYNQRVHGETGQTPQDRWRAGIEQVRYADERLLTQAFLWKERRKADKSGVLSLHGVKYQIGPELAGGYVEVLYDPEDMLEVEIHKDGRLKEHVKPFEVSPWRRPRPKTSSEAPETTSHEPVGDWLGYLVEEKRKSNPAPEPDPRVWKAESETRRLKNTNSVISLLQEHLEEDVVDEVEVRSWLARFGPLDIDRAERELALLLDQVGPGLHARFYLGKLRGALT